MQRFTQSLVVACALLAIAGGARAQTPDQLRQWQQLSPQQRDDVIKAIGKPQSRAAENQEMRDEPHLVVPKREEMEEREPSVIEQRYASRTDAADLRQAQSARAVEQELRQFGYDLFAGTPTTFAPATDIPVPADYVVGPGDTIEVQLFGKDNEQYSLTVSRDGRINFPQIGAINVAGLRFAELRADLEKRVAEQMIGVKASVAMGTLRSIRIFVLGDVTRPGSYTVSALSTLTNALFVSGGVQPIGSLRNVQLKRNGRVVTRLDLYDLLLRGDTSDDVRLQPGDVIFVPPVGPTAGVAGEVRRPAIYELRGESTVRQLVEVAGGLLPTAVPRLSQLERLDARGSLTLVELDLEAEAAAQATVADGDMLRVYPNLDRMEGIVLLAGHVRRPGGVAWHDRMRLTDLIGGPEQLLPRADLDYVVIRREERPLSKVTVFSTRVAAAWADPQSEANVLLEPRDQVFVFAQQTVAMARQAPADDAAAEEELAADEAAQDESGSRRDARPADAQPAVKKTRVQTARSARQTADRSKRRAAETRKSPTGRKAAAAAMVRETETRRAVPAEDTDEELRAADDPDEQVDEEDAVRVDVGPRMATRQELLAPVLEDLIAQAGIKEPTRIVSVGGLVREEGDYPLEPGMRVADLIRAGGGLAEAAYTLGAELTRYSIAGGEKRQVSHIPIELARLLDGDGTANLTLEPHDKLTIKRLPEWAEQLLVEVRGEVRFPGTYPIKRGERLSALLERAGGLTEQAFAEGSIFTREELRLKEQERFDTLARQLEADIAAASLAKAQENAQQAEALGAARALLPQLKAAKAAGRLVIDLPELLEEGANSEYDVVLKGGDLLIIPPRTQEVTVVGEVQYPTSHLAASGLDSSDYIARSGGLTYKADDDRIYVVRANGLVEPAVSGWWIFKRNTAEVRPGDTIVIPLDVERMRPLTLWTAITQIIYHLAVSLAVVHGIGAI